MYTSSAKTKQNKARKTGEMGEEVEENVPIFLSFDDIGVHINDRQILQNVSGKVHPGEMLAVMGPSGSGKTTLLNVLAGRVFPDSGDILLNGKKLNKKLKRKICYVLQEDIFFANLTLLETLTFSAMLRLPDTLPKAEKLKKVQETVDNLDIRKCLDTKIGSPFERGLSGGEKKRANIGCELITNPSLIFLDEPTSGLDSSNALNLVKTLKNFAAREKKTVVTTIHQPSSQIFYMFDKVLLLCGGQVAYYGKASRVLDFFESIGLVCDAHFNPADFILEKVTEGEAVQEQIVNGWTERRKRRGKFSTVSNVYKPELEVTKRSTSENNSKESSQDVASGKEQSPDTAQERETQLAQDASEEETVKNTPSGCLDINSLDLEEISANSLGGDSRCSSPSTDVDGAQDPSSRPDSRTELVERHQADNKADVPNGHVPHGSEETGLLSAAPNDDHSAHLLCPSWKKSKSSDALPPVHTEVQVSSADFSVAVKSYKRSTSQEYTKIDLHDDEEDEDHSGHYTDISTSWATSFWTQFTVLLQRTFKQSKPDILSKINLSQNILLALISSLIWFQLPYREESIVDRYSLIFFIVVYWNFTPMFQSLVSFPNERTVVNKERAAGYYRLSAYYLAKLFSELPLVICQPTLFLTIVYWMTGLNRSEVFLGALAILLLTAIAGQSVGLCIGATVMDFKKSIVVAAVYGLTSMLIGGFYQKNIPSWLAWFQYATYITYSYDAALSIEFYSSPTFSCLEVDSSYASCRNNGTTIHGGAILDNLNVSRTVAQNVGALLLFIVIFRSVTYLALRFLHKPK